MVKNVSVVHAEQLSIPRSCQGRRGWSGPTENMGNARFEELVRRY